MWYLPTTVNSPPTLLSAKPQIAKCNGKGVCFLHPYCCLQQFLDLSCAVTSPPGKPALLLVLQQCSAQGCGSAPHIPRGTCTHWVQAAEAKILHLPSLGASSAPTHLLLLNLPTAASPCLSLCCQQIMLPLQHMCRNRCLVAEGESTSYPAAAPARLDPIPRILFACWPSTGPGLGNQLGNPLLAGSSTGERGSFCLTTTGGNLALGFNSSQPVTGETQASQRRWETGSPPPSWACGTSCLEHGEKCVGSRQPPCCLQAACLPPALPWC